MLPSQHRVSPFWNKPENKGYWLLQKKVKIFDRFVTNPAEGRTFLRILRNLKACVWRFFQGFVPVFRMALFLDRWRAFNNHGEQNTTVANQFANIYVWKLWTCALSMYFSVHGGIFLAMLQWSIHWNRISTADLQNGQRKERDFDAFQSYSFVNNIICDKIQKTLHVLKAFLPIWFLKMWDYLPYL